DKQGDREGAVRQLLRSVELARRDLKLYQELGRRLEELRHPKETERAYTSLVEVLPNEAESHALLAEVRERQNLWPEAIAQWQHAARLRALEPTGLLKLATAQVHERQWDQAGQTLQKVKETGWPARFGDVVQQMRALEQQIEKGRKDD